MRQLGRSTNDWSVNTVSLMFSYGLASQHKPSLLMLLSLVDLLTWSAQPIMSQDVTMLVFDSIGMRCRIHVLVLNMSF